LTSSLFLGHYFWGIVEYSGLKWSRMDRGMEVKKEN